MNKLHSPECEKAIGFWKIGIQYIHLVESVTTETIKQGNKYIVVLDGTATQKEFNEEIKWSDMNLVIPLLFNFYHGVEVILKGFLLSQEKELEKIHKLSGLLNDFNILFPNHRLGGLLSRYIITEQLPEPLASFCSASSISIDNYYEALKYPEGKNGVRQNGNIYKFSPLMYQGEDGLIFFSALAHDISDIRLETIALARIIYPNDGRV